MPQFESMESPTSLTSGNFSEAEEPLRLFAAWFDDATRAEPSDPSAMALATVDAGGLPNVRMVLLKGFDERGFVFYTNTQSPKAGELAAVPKAAAVFSWKSLKRQVRLRGTVECVTDAEADAYFATRPKGSQIGAWASKQSAPMEHRLALEQAVALYTARYALGAVPRPAYWSGYRIVPLAMEFWHDRPFRLHERIEFRRADANAPWLKTRLYP
jgi:pyridoxamine 5'-phosphate oxidase